MPDYLFPFLVRVLISFLIGSIPFAVIAMMGTGVDIRKFGSGNPGFNNVLRYSKIRAVFTLVGDVGKGCFAIWLLQSGTEPEVLRWIYGLAAIKGHCYSPWLRFDGGKGIATAAGVMLMLFPAWTLACVPVYLGGRLLGSRLKNLPEKGALSSLAASAVFTLLVFLFETRLDAFFAVLLLSLLVWRHKQNIANVLAGSGTERA